MNLGDMFVTIGAKLEGFRAAMNEVKGTLNSTASQMKTVGTVMSAAVTLPLVGAGLAALKTAGELEQTGIAFKTMMKSSVAAGEHLKELKAFALSTPFEFRELTLASKRMQALGFDAKAVIPALRNIGDAASGLGMGAEGIQRIVTALGQMQAKGKVQAEEMRQLTEAGIASWEILAKTLNTDVAGAMKAVEKRTVDASIAVPALLAGMNAKFGGLMKAQADTLLGQFSQLKDQLFFVLSDIGTALAPSAKSMMEGVFKPALEVVKTLAAAFSELPQPIQTAIIGMLAFTVAIGPVTYAMGGLISLFTNSGLLIAKYAAAIADLGTSSLSVLASQYGKVGAAYTAMLATGILRVSLWAGLAYSVYDVANAYLALKDAQDKVAKTQAEGSTLLLEYEIRLRRQGVNIDEAARKYGQGEIGIREYRAELNRLRDEHLKLHPVIQATTAAQKALNAEAIKDAFAELGIKDLRLELAQAVTAFGLLHTAGKFAGDQMLVAAGHIAKLRNELNGLTKEPLKMAEMVGPSLEALKDLQLELRFINNMPMDLRYMNLLVQPEMESLSGFFRDAFYEVHNAADLAGRDLKITSDAFREMGETSGKDLENLAKKAEENFGIMQSSGEASLDALTRAWVKWQRAVNNADVAMGRITDEAHDDAETNLKDIEARTKKEEAATQTIARDRYDLSRELEQMSRRTFDSLNRDIARNIVQWKGWKDSIKNIGKGLAEDFLSIMMKALFKPLEDQFANIAKKLGTLLSGGGSSAAGTATTAAGGAASSGAKAAGAAGTVVSAGLAGIVSAVTGVITAVSSVIGNFQMAGMNKSLDLIEKATRYTEIYTGGQDDSILATSHEMRDTLRKILASTTGLVGINLSGTLSGEQSNQLINNLLNGSKNFYEDSRTTLHSILAAITGGTALIVGQLHAAANQPLWKQLLSGGLLSNLGGAIGGVLKGIGGGSGGFLGGLVSGDGAKLDLIANHTLRMFNEIYQQRIDHWDQHNGTFTRLGEIWNTLQDGGGGGGFTFTNCTFGAGTSKDQIQAWFREAVAARG